MCRRGHFGVHVRPHPQESVDKHPCPHMSVNGTDVYSSTDRWWGAAWQTVLNITLLVKWWQTKNRFQWHNQCVVETVKHYFGFAKYSSSLTSVLLQLGKARAALQIQDRSPESRPVTSLNQSQMQLTRPVRSWNAPRPRSWCKKSSYTLAWSDKLSYAGTY